MKIKLSSILAVILISLTINSSYAALNNPIDFEPYFKTGNCNIDSGKFQTGNDGQLFIQKQEDFELRLKQNTSVSVSKNPLAQTDELIIDKGLVGLKVASDTLLIKTPYACIRLRNATVIINVSEHMTRLCVLKGTAVLKQKTTIISVKATNEIAAAKNKVSQTYKFLDDLRYVWYWTSPDKEPSLK